MPTTKATDEPEPKPEHKAEPKAEAKGANDPELDGVAITTNDVEVPPVPDVPLGMPGEAITSDDVDVEPKATRGH